MADLNTSSVPAGGSTCWVHWGRSGGGPRFLLELTEGDLLNPGVTLLSFNPDAEIASRLEALPVSSIAIPTYNSKLGVILGLPRLAYNAVRMRRWLRTRNVKRVVGVMESVYQSLALPLLVPRSIEYVACIHDGEHHPGESNFVQRLGRRIELKYADRLVTFSDSVQKILEQQSSKPISVGSHPPFGMRTDGVPARRFPQERPFVFGLFGRLQQYKGVELLLQAAELLRTDPHVPEFEVKIIGFGPEEHLKSSPLGSQAEWDIRWIPEDEVDSLVGSFDAMILPYTSASQSGPITLAKANAIPCVVTPVGALPFQAAGFGAVATDTTPEAVAEAMRSVLQPETYEGLSAAAVEQLRTSQTWAQLAQMIREGA